MADIKKTAIAAIENTSNSLNTLSQDIWEHPELNYKEHHAHKVLTDFLENQGFKVERNYKLETAFKATFGEGNGGPRVCVICEYDALPEIGHACGHNLIAEAGAAAGIGIKSAMKSHPECVGEVGYNCILIVFRKFTSVFKILCYVFYRNAIRVLFSTIPL